MRRHSRAQRPQAPRSRWTRRQGFSAQITPNRTRLPIRPRPSAKLTLRTDKFWRNLSGFAGSAVALTLHLWRDLIPHSRRRSVSTRSCEMPETTYSLSRKN